MIVFTIFDLDLLTVDLENRDVDGVLENGLLILLLIRRHKVNILNVSGRQVDMDRRARSPKEWLKAVMGVDSARVKEELWGLDQIAHICQRVAFDEIVHGL